jgi:hypothetical protein
LYGTEHFSEHAREEWHMRVFREVIEWFAGSWFLPYTWDNRQDGTANVKVRIDRVFGNAALLNLF